MELQEKAKLLRNFVGESDRYDGKPLYEAIVKLVRERSIAGATVLRGILGSGPTAGFIRQRSSGFQKSFP